MKKIFIKEANSLPRFIGESNGIIEIKGKSMMENPLNFYNDVYSLLINLMNSSVSSITVKIDLLYINSSSRKQLLRHLMLINESNKKCKICWSYPSGNAFLRRKGEGFEIMLDIPFEYVAKKV